jgi:hypothetical protein
VNVQPGVVPTSFSGVGPRSIALTPSSLNATVFSGSFATSGTVTLAEREQYRRRRGITWHAFHLLWTLPLAWVIGYGLWFAARLGWCGYGGCWGTNAHSPQLEYGLGIALSIICGLAIVAAVVAPPWLWPWWIRVIIAIPLAALDMYYYGWGNAPSIIPFIHPLYSTFY